MATAAADVFSVGGIHVDASGPSASVAQLAAMAQGRPKAWAILYKRITKQQDWGRQPTARRRLAPAHHPHVHRQK